jgi:Arc/MetJ family transcription regulator
MHRTTIEIDEKKLARARRVLGTKGIKDTLERALDEVLAMELRKKAVARLVTLDGTDLADDEVMKTAWR